MRYMLAFLPMLFVFFCSYGVFNSCANERVQTIGQYVITNHMKTLGLCYSVVVVLNFGVGYTICFKMKIIWNHMHCSRIDPFGSLAAPHQNGSMAAYLETLGLILLV